MCILSTSEERGGEPLKALYNSENGAVSVYLILIIIPVFLFQAVLIDFARVKLAEKETESAVRAALRSTMSAYDTELQTMGLFGIGVETEEAESIFRSMFELNLSGGTEGGFRFIDTVPVAGEERLTPVYSLANQTVIQRQILEEMKYKAPIEFALAITDKFKKSGITAPMKQGSLFAMEAEKLEKLLDERDDFLNEAWDHAEKYNDKIKGLYAYYQSRIQELSSMAAQIGIHTVEDIQASIHQIDREVQSVYESISSYEGSLSKLMREAKANKASIESILQAMQSLQTQIDELNERRRQWVKLLELIMKYTALVAVTKREVSAERPSIVGLQQNMDSSLQSAKRINDKLRQELHRLTESTDNSHGVYQNAFESIWVLEDEYFRSYQASVANVTALFTGFTSAVASVDMYTQVNTSRVETANDTYKSQMDEFYIRQGQLERTRMEARNRVSFHKREQRNNIQQVLEQAKQAIGGCSMTEGANADAAHYRVLQAQGNAAGKGLYQKYAEMNGKDGQIGSGVVYELDKPDRVTFGAMELIGSIANAAEGLRDELFMNEFALTKFNYRTYGMEKDGAGQPIQDRALSDASLHRLAGQEVEYLLYGFSSCMGNISSAYGEIFAFRLAVRTIEALMDPQKSAVSLGSPLLLILTAAAEGAVKAFQDMNKLINGESVELSAKLASSAWSLTYKDYLRIFLLLHSTDHKLMARMQALIELNTGKDLRDATTYMQGYAKSSVKLWFFPGMAKALNGVGLLDCRVTGNRCEWTKSAALSY